MMTKKESLNQLTKQEDAGSLNFDGEKSVADLKKSQLNAFDELESYKKLRKKRIKKSFVRMAIWLSIIIFVPVMVFFTIIIASPSAGHNFFGYSVYMVTSHSMVGVFDKGDCIVVRKVRSSEEIKVGTDISFIRKSDGETVTHRVVGIIENENGTIEYLTKGVNNLNIDTNTVAYDEVLGVMVAVSAGLGNFIGFFRTTVGVITFLIVFVCLSMLINIFFKLSDDIKAVGGK